MKHTSLSLAAAVLGAVLMSTTAQAAAPGASQSLKVQAGQTAIEQVALRCRRVCNWRHGHRHCKIVCRQGHGHGHGHRRHRHH